MEYGSGKHFGPGKSLLEASNLHTLEGNAVFVLYMCLFFPVSGFFSENSETNENNLGFFHAFFCVMPEVIDYNQRKYEIEIVEACEPTAILLIVSV